ncbi:MAG TPA: TonB family protein [Pyrinomonadaceae bacterium]|nr:TonB family protein [Pyrinomonadaceae bacterium]
MRLFFLRLPVVFLFLLTIGSSAAHAQSAPAAAATADWETLRPEGEEFSVLMPKGSTFQTSKEPYHKMELNTRTYLFSSKSSGPVFAVVSLSGIKSNPALYTEMQRLNSYVDAFKTLFAPKIRKDAIAKLTLVGEKNLQGHPGREYRLTIGDLAGTAQVFATRKRFYSLVYLNTKKDDALQEQFLSSFVLPEKGETPPTAAVQTPSVADEGTASGGTSDTAPAKPAANAERESRPDDAARAEPGKRAPISAGVLNGKAISLPKPDYPPEARAAGAEGVVVIQVTIDELGNVAEARAISGPKMLQEVSVNAALQAKFTPTLVAGEPVRVTGVLVFNFGRPMS